MMNPTNKKETQYYNYHRLNPDATKYAKEKRKTTTPDTKFCSKCHQTLKRTAFGVHQNRYDGLQPYCKPCNRISVRISEKKSRSIKQ